MNENIFYIDAKTKIVDFLTTEFSGTFPLKLQNRFLNFFPQIANYEEEGQKYKPAIFFTNNIDAVVKNIPNATKIVLFFFKRVQNYYFFLFLQKNGRKK